MPITAPPDWLTGLHADATTAPDTPTTTPKRKPLAPPTPGSVAAQVLMDVWAGRPLTVVASPPGGGKTHLVTTLATHLASGANLKVAVACQTNSQVEALVWRFAALTFHCPLRWVTTRTIPAAARPNLPALTVTKEMTTEAMGGGAAIAVGTTHQFAAHRAKRAQWRPDVLIVDEAGQLTVALYRELDGWADQTVAVGDPGQLPPVVTGDVSAWRDARIRPEASVLSTLVNLRRNDAALWQMPSTWRLGARTTAAIQPVFYPDLAFTSARPPVTIASATGDRPEAEVIVVQAGAAAPAAPTILAPITARVEHLLADSTVTTDDGTRTLTTRDIAVVAPHRVQVALLRRQVPNGVTVLTTEQAQGLEWPAVVALHPLAGHRGTPEFNLCPERLCVVVSRHSGHLSLVTPTPVLDALRAADPAIHGVLAHRHLLDALAAS